MHYYDARDYDSRYRGTYVGYREGDTVVPFLVNSVRDGDPISMVGHKIREDGTRDQVTRVDVNDPNLQLFAPKLGLSGHNGELLYLRRKPHRRWKQGLSLDSCSIRWYIRSSETEERGLNVYKVFNPTRTPFDEAIQSVFEVPRRGYSITPSVGIVPHEDNQFCHVVHKVHKVGEYIRERSSLVLTKKNAPLVDTMRRAGFNNVEVLDD